MTSARLAAAYALDLAAGDPEWFPQSLDLDLIRSWIWGRA